MWWPLGAVATGEPGARIVAPNIPVRDTEVGDGSNDCAADGSMKRSAFGPIFVSPLSIGGFERNELPGPPVWLLYGLETDVLIEALSDIERRFPPAPA